MLVRESNDPKLPARVEAAELDGDFDPDTRVILTFVDKLTLHSNQMEESDLAPLREVGLSDEQILDVVMVASYYAFKNRVVQALGVGDHAKEDIVV